jgi:hypothetical protein
VHPVVSKYTQFNLPGGSDLHGVRTELIVPAEVLELKNFINEWSCPEVKGRRLGVHKAAHDNKTENDLEENEDVVYQVHRQLMRELDLLDYRNDAERYDEENCEYRESYQFGELKQKVR